MFLTLCRLFGRHCHKIFDIKALFLNLFYLCTAPDNRFLKIISNRLIQTTIFLIKSLPVLQKFLQFWYLSMTSIQVGLFFPCGMGILLVYTIFLVVLSTSLIVVVQARAWGEGPNQRWANLDQASKHLEVFRFRDLSPTPIP